MSSTSTAPRPDLLAAVKRRLEPRFLEALADIAQHEGASGVDALLAPFLDAPRRGPVPLGPIRCFVVGFYRRRIPAAAT